MCYHRRTLYSCLHNGWGRQVRTCNLHKAFLDGTFSKACDTMNAHPLHSLRIQTACHACAKKREKTFIALTKLKAELLEMKEKMARAQKGRGSSDGGSVEGEHAASIGIDDGKFDPIILKSE
ncbi:hypothetical protein BKA65DRAFT_395066 [Rhexocercosporidium sp. MPI-PUGE-AT-0058]|nr:hypothetical protein BKA65DRAFT_395066 [Rhexocercosporidium sp. MPI-PUGE-AT-0058]